MIMAYHDDGRCDSCEKHIKLIPEWSLKEQNSHIYGNGKLGSAYCPSCAKDFVENEYQDGVRS
jgi:hypothetical protein